MDDQRSLNGFSCNPFTDDISYLYGQTGKHLTGLFVSKVEDFHHNTSSFSMIIICKIIFIGFISTLPPKKYVHFCNCIIADFLLENFKFSAEDFGKRISF